MMLSRRLILMIALMIVHSELNAALAQPRLAPAPTGSRGCEPVIPWSCR